MNQVPSLIPQSGQSIPCGRLPRLRMPMPLMPRAGRGMPLAAGRMPRSGRLQMP